MNEVREVSEEEKHDEAGKKEGKSRVAGKQMNNIDDRKG